MIRFVVIACTLAVLSLDAAAQTTTRSSSTRNQAGGTATDTTYMPLYNFNRNNSIGGYSSTTTRGGYQEGGSGQAIPNNTRGSQQDTTRGIMFERRF